MTHNCDVKGWNGSRFYCAQCGAWHHGEPGASTSQRLWVPVVFWVFALIFWLVHGDERLRKKDPDLIIGPPSDPQTKRWHILKRRGWQLALHEWHRSDHDRALHDHSADNWSIILDGWYDEVFSHRWEAMRMKLRRPWIPFYRRADEPHRVVIEPRVLNRGRCYTLWLRMPPRREWGFVCKHGWRHNADYIAERNYYDSKASTVGKGCD